MSATLLPAAARSASPWKNGGGVTREVAAFPETGAGLTDFDWRISLAEVAADGPFSAFDGYDRVITVVRGAGMALTVDGVEHVVDKAYAPFAFSGGSTTECRLLGGPITDFNVMTRIGAVEAEVDVTGSPARAGAPTVVVVVFEGRVVVTDAQGAEMCRVDGALDAVVLRGEAVATIVPDGESVFAVVRLNPAG
jgi:environmental stress-induced protein Ves